MQSVPLLFNFLLTFYPSQWSCFLVFGRGFWADFGRTWLGSVARSRSFTTSTSFFSRISCTTTA